MMSSEAMEDLLLIGTICQKCYHSLRDVDYKYIRAALKSEDVLTVNHLSDLDNKTERQQNEELFLHIAPKLGMDRFKKLINVLRTDYPHVAKKLIEELNSVNANQNQEESQPSVTNTRRADNSANLDQSNNYSSMGLPELPESMQGCRLTGTECQEDVRRLCDVSLAVNQLQPCNGTTLHQSSGIQPDGQPLVHYGFNELRSNEPPTITARPGNLAYTMDTHPRGIALIINNNVFKHFKKRDGTINDRENLAQMFHDLGWQVTTKTNLTAKDMDEYMKKLAQSKRLDTVSALAVAILTHGLDSDNLFGIDGCLASDQPVSGTYISRVQVMQNFSCTNCKQMEGKPKWFILQACRGSSEDILPTSTNAQRAPAITNPQPDTSSDIAGDSPTLGLTGQGQPWVERQKPNLADMFCLFASSPGHKAYRRKALGSPFITTLIKCVKEHSRNKHLVDIVKEIQVQLSNEVLPSHKLTLPEYSSMLLKDWYFCPPF